MGYQQKKLYLQGYDPECEKIKFRMEKFLKNRFYAIFESLVVITAKPARYFVHSRKKKRKLDHCENDRPLYQ